LSGAIMKPFVALLRGINVGGRNPLPMKSLVALLEELGCSAVKTYIQSGNVVLRSRSSAPRLAAAIGREIHRRHGFEPHVLLLTLDEFNAAIAANPFPEATKDPAGLHLGFLDSIPTNPKLQRMEELKTKTERFRLIGKVLYLHAPDGVGRSKLAAQSERLLGVPMTDRNWRTICAIRRLAEAC
jgi:uncharacterized protein (DUF1697 family)